MWVPRRDKLPQESREELDEILFPVVALECEVRFLLSLFVRMLLSELSLHSGFTALVGKIA